MKVTVSYSNHFAYNYKAVKIPFDKVMDLVKSDFNYSAGTFKDGHRNKDNYLNYTDLIILDIDEGLTINEAKNVFEPFDYIIATTRSHQKEKCTDSGTTKPPCDRFRVILPCEVPIELNKEDYTKLMVKIHNKFNFVDHSCKDASRFYYPFKESYIFKHQGFCRFDWSEFWNEVKEDEKENERLIEFRKNYIGYKKVKEEKIFQGKQLESSLDFYRKYAFTDRELKALKFDDKFVSGQRNNTLLGYLKHFQGIGMDNDEIRQHILFINNSGDGLSEQELETTIFRKLK